MDIILGVYLLLIVVSVRLQDRDEDFLSAGDMEPIRGVMAIAIILHHMSERTNGGRLFPFMVHMGYLIVAVFFFLSGYGLMIQFLKKGERYLKGYWKSRVFYISAVFAFASLIYSIYHLVIGNFTPSLTIAANSWYMVVQILLYIIFWCAFKIAGKGYSIGILFVFAMQTLMVIVMRMIALPGIWYMSNYAFVLGLIVAWKRDLIDRIIQQRFVIASLASVLMFGVFSALPSVIMGGGYDTCRMASTICFTLIVMLLCSKIRIESKIWSWLGKISLEIYLYHGLVYMVLRKFMTNDFWWTLSTVLLTIPVAYFASLVNTRIKGLLKR